MSEFIQKLFTSYKTRTDGDTRIGQLNRIWYDSETNTFRIQLDDTPGGTIIGGGGTGGGDYTLPTASTTVKGGVKIDGTTITINNQVISGFSGSYTDLSNKPALFSGSYTDLTNKPTIPAAQVNSDWNASSGLAQILNKPALFSGSYTDLTNKPTLFDGAYASLTGKPTLFSGSYNDLTDKPTIPSAYTLPTATDTILGGVKIGSNITINAGVISVAAPFSGSYTDLTNKPTIPAAQIQSDWTQSNNASLDFIKNKPTIPDIGPIQEVFSATTEPMGHADKSQSTISFNDSTRTFTISPVSGSYNVWVKGAKFVISTTRTVTIPNTTGLYYIYFDAAGALQYQTTYFDWPNQAPTAYVYWNSGTGKAPMVADERHGIVLDWQTHEYLHRTRGAAIANGFGASNYILGGNGSLNTHIQLDIASGTFFDEDLQVDVVSTNTPTANTWEQDLTGPSQIPIFYLSGTTGWVRDNPTTFPLKRGSVRPVYNLNTAGTWSTPDIDNNKFGVTFIIATNNINYPVMGVISQTQHANQNDAEAIEWNDLNLTGFPVVEFRPLYKVVYQTKTSYSNTPKATIVSVWDLRSFASVISSAASFVDANALSGTVLAPAVVTSSLTSVGTLTNLTVTNTIAGSINGSVLWINSTPAPGDPFRTAISAASGNASISLSTGLPELGSTVSWTFDTTKITFPDTTTQTTAYTGNAATATKLATARAINGVNFDGSAAITVTAAAGTLTGVTLNSTVVNSSLTSVGTLTSLAVTNSSSSPVNVTYTPASTTGQAILATGKDTQGGTGYFDFLKVTNTTSGVTNGSKTFRLSSTGAVEIVNSDYSSTLLILSNTGNLSISGDYQVSGKKAVNGPAFRAYVSTAQTLSSGSQLTVTFGAENFDTDNCFTSNTFTPTIEGYYQFNATVRIDGPASTGEIMIVLYKNANEYARGTNEGGTEQGANWYSMQVSDIAYANGTTDSFHIRIQQTSGSNKTTTAGSTISYFSGVMVRGA